ncbi:hypothetical protein [Kitasatospora sp. NPDC001175]|uniref:hypothetical protein n=1 Tax=Kitasatospora sp. NPDC001175 TaxID=3157103 RepID=UPI003CFE1A99
MIAEREASVSTVVAVADKFVDETHLAAARSVLERVVDTDKVRLAFVGGSLAAGLGHGMSDVDLYVAAEPGTDLPKRGYREGGYVVQINPLSTAQLEQIAAICTEFTASRTDRWQVLVGDVELQPSIRYAIGSVLIDKDSGLPSTDQAKLTVRKILMTRWAYDVSGFGEDALGALQVGDELTALQSSSIAVECAVECVLAAVGDVYLGRKFLLRRTARNEALREVLPRIWDGLRLPQAPGGIEETTRVVTENMRVAGHLVVNALLDGWDAPAPHIAACPDHWEDGGPTRSPWVVPVRLSDSWGMAGPDAGYRVKQGTVRLWRELDGRSLDDVHRSFEADPDLAGTPRELLDTATAQLIERNVVATGDGVATADS